MAYLSKTSTAIKAKVQLFSHNDFVFPDSTKWAPLGKEKAKFQLFTTLLQASELYPSHVMFTNFCIAHNIKTGGLDEARQMFDEMSLKIVWLYGTILFLGKQIHLLLFQIWTWEAWFCESALLYFHDVKRVYDSIVAKKLNFLSVFL